MNKGKRNISMISGTEQLFCDLLKMELQLYRELQTALSAIQNAIVKGQLESLRELIICEQTLVDRLLELQKKRQSCLEQIVLKNKLPEATSMLELHHSFDEPLQQKAEEILSQIGEVCQRIQNVNRENQIVLKVSLGLNNEFFKTAFPGFGETEMYSSDGHIREESRPLNLMDRQI